MNESNNGADALMDLVILSDFRGTLVPRASPAGSCLSTFGPLLTHPNSVSFPWSTLRSALESYFQSSFINFPIDLPPRLPPLDATKIASGWCGLQLIVSAYKRVEAVQSLIETLELVTWLQAIKIAVCRRSLSLESFEPSSAGILQNVLANLIEPIAPSELVNITRSRTTSLSTYTNTKPLASTSTSFERGSDATRSPPPSIPSVAGSLSPPTNSNSTITMKRTAGSPITGGVGFVLPNVKRRRSNSNLGSGALGTTGGYSRGPRDSTVSTSALSSFPDFSDHQDLDSDADQHSDSSSSTSSSSSRLALASTSSKATTSSSQSTSTTTINPANLTLQQKIQILSKRLSKVTGISLEKCVESISRFPDEELGLININDPIPVQFLPMAAAGAAGGKRLNHSSSAPTLQSPTRGSNGRSTGSGTGGSGGRIGGVVVKKSTAASKREGSTESTSKSSVTSTSGTRQQKAHDPNRPGFSYSALIGQAILSVPDKRLRLAEIYDFVTSHYPYYKKNECGWQNSIRHNLSLQPVFQKVPDPTVTNGSGKKGCFWTILPAEEWRFANGGWLKMDKVTTTSLSSSTSTSKSTKSATSLSKTKGRVLPPSAVSGGRAIAGGTTGKKVGAKRDLGEEEEDRLLDQLQNKIAEEREEGDLEGDVEGGDGDVEDEDEGRERDF